MDSDKTPVILQRLWGRNSGAAESRGSCLQCRAVSQPVTALVGGCASKVVNSSGGELALVVDDRRQVLPSHSAPECL